MLWNNAAKVLALTVCSQSLVLPVAGAQTLNDETLTATVSPAKDVVTVYDTIQRAQDLALSVEVLPQAALESVALVHPAEVLNRVAGVNIHRGSGQEHLTAIRSPVLTGGAGAGSFLFLEDGVPLRAAGFANVNGLFEAGTEFASSIDVIKGPGPATYGSNAVHGLVNISSPNIWDAKNRFSVMGSGEGYLSMAATHIQNANAHRLSGSMSLVNDNGFRSESGFDQQKFQLKYDGALGRKWDAQWLTSYQNLNQETAGFIEGIDAYKDDAVRFANPNPEAFRDAKSYRTQARLERAVGVNTLAITPYARRSELRFLRHFVPGQALEKNAHSSVGFQSAYYNDNFNVGFDTEYTRGDVYEFQASPSQFSFVQGLHYDYQVGAITAAAYGEKTLSLADGLDLDLGARGEYTHYDYDNRASTGAFGRFIRAEDRKDSFFTLTPKASLSFTASDNLNVYTRAARGSRAPQVTDLYSAQQNQVPGEASVETLDSLEAGLKYNRNTAVFQAAIFTMWKGGFFFRNANGFNVVNGKTRHSGIEVSFNAPLSNRLSLSGDGTLAKHSYDFNEIVGSAANDIIKGRRVDTAPNTLAHIRAQYQFTEKIMTEIEWRHMGSYFTDPGNTAEYPGHDIFVLRGHYAASDSLTVFARMDNVFNVKYADRADFAFGNERYFPGRPRTVFLGIRGTY